MSKAPLTEPKVAVLVPSTGPVDLWLMKYLDHYADPLVERWPYHHSRGGFVEDVRQKLLNRFLEQSRAPWALLIDADTVPRIGPLDMVRGAEEQGLRLVTGATPIHSSVPGVCANLFFMGKEGHFEPIPWHALPWSQKERYWGPVQVAGLSCTLVHRQVLESLMAEADAGRIQYPFRGIWHRGELKCSEDFCFFMRCAKTLGERLWLDLEQRCIHKGFSPRHAIEDLPFLSPEELANPDAPSIEDQEIGAPARTADQANAPPEPEERVEFVPGVGRRRTEEAVN